MIFVSSHGLLASCENDFMWGIEDAVEIRL